MAKSKKVVLFLVEGITEQVSLGLVLSRLVEKDNTVKFKIIGGDITTKDGTSSSNILNKITNVIKEFIGKDIYTKKDISKIIHIVDTDGVFITPDKVLYKEIDEIEYSEDTIYSKNVDSIVNRNRQKASILNKLISINNVYKDIPYSIYFFSLNLEHVLHNNPMTIADKKMEYAEEFESKFSSDIGEFIKFINCDTFAVRGDYNYSWSFIKEGINSLNRFSNFHLFINENSR